MTSVAGRWFAIRQALDDQSGSVSVWFGRGPGRGMSGLDPVRARVVVVFADDPRRAARLGDR